MDFKPVISNCGDEKLYKGLSSEVERRLPSSAVGWKRSFGRPQKPVVLQASFSKFNSTQLMNNNVESIANLTSIPMLHIYWTSCMDTDTYKNVVKGQISNWQKHLNVGKSEDWLIIHVLYQDNSKPTKPKIQLPRSSVFDKIKSDFAQGRQERCVQLWEPDKETLFTKSNESWQFLLNQIRGLLLQSFGRYLESFEDRIRTMREKYADPKWPFVNYFLVHEELAFIYQSITLNEDALVQYDEVDALLSQFIINNSGKNLPIWLDKLSQKPSTWDGVLLSSSVAGLYKDVIQSDKATLLELRNYLFLRQCKLLSKLKRRWEIPSRLQEFLFTVIHELKLLKVDAPDYVVACWIILTCLQIIPILEKEDTNGNSFFATIAQVYDLMRQKYHLLGHVTGLYCDKEQTDEQKVIVNKLKSGFGKFTRNNNNTIVLLQEAFSDPKSFQNLYIELTQNCIDKYSKINRLHFNMFVGIDLAKFHLHHGRYQEAEPLLEKAWSIYKAQKWETLYSDVLIPLAACQLKHELHDKYLNSVTLLSCAQCLSKSTREFYSKEVLRLSKNSTLNFPVISFNPVFKVVNIKNDLIRYKGHIGDTVRIIVSIVNNLTLPAECKQINLIAKHRDLSNPDSFAENVLSARKSLFDQKDYGMNVTLSPTEKPMNKTETKEPLTPSNLIKRIKSHRRTWSKNKNGIETTTENKVETTSLSEPVPPPSESSTRHSEMESQRHLKAFSTTEENTDVRKSLFQGDNNQEQEKSEASASNGSKSVSKDAKPSVNDTKSTEAIPKRSSLLELAASKSDDSISDKLNEETKEISSSDKDLQNGGHDLSLDLSQISPDQSTSTSLKTEQDSTINMSSVFLDPEFEEILDVALISKEQIILQPGHNKVVLSAKIIHEGKYTMQCINCFVGNLSFYKSLKAMSRKTSSFFMVADPPRVTWTTDYLVDYVLSGSKQRIHVTLMNGPGVILKDSIICIFSKTGLLFYTLDTSPIEIFPLERDGKVRLAEMSISIDDEGENAYLKLPSCQPYERVNIYFDVIAPMHQEFGQMSTCQHEINFSCEWLESLVPTLQRLDLIFYEPFQLKHDILNTKAGVFIKLTLCGVNPVQLIFSNPKIVLTNTNIQLELMSKQQDIHIYNIEEVTFLWKLKDTDYQCVEESGNLDCSFSINFKTKENAEVSETFTKPLQFKMTKPLFSVDVTLNPDEKPIKSEPCTIHIEIQKLNSDYSTKSQLCLKLDPKEHFWRLSNQTMHELDFTEVNCVEIDLEVICTATGTINMPLVCLCKTDEVRPVEEKSSTEVVTVFEPDEIEYLACAKIIQVGDPPHVVTQV